MPILLSERKRYASRRAKLSKAARLALEYVEEAIAADPDHRERRRERDDGAIIDWNCEGLLVAYRRTSPTTGELIELIDLKSLPPEVVE